MTLAVDLSNYTTDERLPGAYLSLPPDKRPGGRITPELVKCWRDNGFDHAIVGTQWPLIAQHQLEVCGAGGMTLDAYHWLWFDRDYLAELGRSVDAVKAYPIRRLWIDIEDASTSKSAEEMIKISHRVMELAETFTEGLPFDLGIYTGKWWWEPKMGNYSGLSHYPLWLANYLQPVEGQWPSRIPNRSELDKLPAPFAGWTSAAMWQYAGSVRSLCNSNLDFNVTFEAVTPTTPPEDDEMKTHNAWAAWFENREVPASEDRFVAQVRSDFSLPAEAKSVVMQAVMEAGSMEWFHGGSGTPAARLGEGTLLVVLDEQGQADFRSVAGCVIKRLYCVGYYK